MESEGTSARGRITRGHGGLKSTHSPVHLSISHRRNDWMSVRQFVPVNHRLTARAKWTQCERQLDIMMLYLGLGDLCRLRASCRWLSEWVNRDHTWTRRGFRLGTCRGTCSGSSTTHDASGLAGFAPTFRSRDSSSFGDEDVIRLVIHFCSSLLTADKEGIIRKSPHESFWSVLFGLPFPAVADLLELEAGGKQHKRPSITVPLYDGGRLRLVNFAVDLTPDNDNDKAVHRDTADPEDDLDDEELCDGHLVVACTSPTYVRLAIAIAISLPGCLCVSLAVSLAGVGGLVHQNNEQAQRRA